jgi:hypothetical protein
MATMEQQANAANRLKAAYIRIPNFLTDDEIANIPIEKVYEWVRTGQWKQKDFKCWLKVMRVIE